MKKVILSKGSDTNTSKREGFNTIIKLDGRSSTNSYPSGWNKSYVFKDFQSFERIYFIGNEYNTVGYDCKGYIKTRDHRLQTYNPESTGRIVSEVFRRPTSENTLPPSVQAPPP